jgi:hypothetical protein
MLAGILERIDTYCPLITLIIYLLNLKKIARQELILLFYLAINVLTFGLANFLEEQNIENLFVYHLYSLIELVIIAYYLSFILLERKKLFFVVTISYTCFWLLNIMMWEPLDSFNSNAFSVSSLIILILSMYYLLQISQRTDTLSFLNFPRFWFSSAFLISSAIAIPSLVAYNYFGKNNESDEAISVWILTTAGNTFKFILLIIGLLCYRRAHTTSSISS